MLFLRKTGMILAIREKKKQNKKPPKQFLFLKKEYRCSKRWTGRPESRGHRAVWECPVARAVSMRRLIWAGTDNEDGKQLLRTGLPAWPSYEERHTERRNDILAKPNSILSVMTEVHHIPRSTTAITSCQIIPKRRKKE